MMLMKTKPPSYQSLSFCVTSGLSFFWGRSVRAAGSDLYIIFMLVLFFTSLVLAFKVLSTANYKLWPRVGVFVIFIFGQIYLFEFALMMLLWKIKGGAP